MEGVAQLAIDWGVDFERMDRDGAYGCRSALTCAIAKGSTLTLQVLLDNGADPNRTDDEGYTALDRLVMVGHRPCGRPIVENEIARILENAGAHPGKLAVIDFSRPMKSAYVQLCEQGNWSVAEVDSDASDSDRLRPPLFHLDSSPAAIAAIRLQKEKETQQAKMAKMSALESLL